MSYAEKVKKVVFTPNQDHLRLCELRLGSLKVNKSNPSEIARLEAARLEIMGRMVEGEHAEYVKLTTAELTPSEKKALIERERIAMESNKDSNSI